MSNEMVAVDSFESDVESIVDQAESLVNQEHFSGSVEYETYRSNEPPVDVELRISGEFAELSGVMTAVQASDYWTVCTLAHSGSRNAVVMGLTYHGSVAGVFQTELY